MSRPVRVSEVEWLGGRRLRVTFVDGLVRELDFADSLPGLLSTIDSDEAFATAGADPVAGTVAWPNGIDLDPDVLRGEAEPASAPNARLVREYRLQAAG